MKISTTHPQAANSQAMTGATSSTLPSITSTAARTSGIFTAVGLGPQTVAQNNAQSALQISIDPPSYVAPNERAPVGHPQQHPNVRGPQTVAQNNALVAPQTFAGRNERVPVGQRQTNVSEPQTVVQTAALVAPQIFARRDERVSVGQRQTNVSGPQTIAQSALSMALPMIAQSTRISAAQGQQQPLVQGPQTVNQTASRQHEPVGHR